MKTNTSFMNIFLEKIDRLKLFYFIVISHFFSEIFDLYNYKLAISAISIINNIFIILFIILFYIYFFKRILIFNKIDILISLTLIIFFNFVYWSILLKDTIFVQFLISKGVNHRIAEIFIIATLFFLFFKVIKFTNSPLINIVTYTKIFFIFFTVFIIITKINYKVNNIKIENVTDFQDNINNVDKPDIYYIIIDAYASNSSLKNKFNFDNTYFTQYLKDKGFFIPNTPKSSYNYTPTSLASILNMSYLNLNQNATLTADDITILDSLIKNNNVTNYLSKYGYKNNFYTILNIGEERSMPFGIDKSTPFNSSFINLLFKSINKLNPNKKYLLDCYNYNKNAFNFFHDKILLNNNDSLPTFNLIHILSSHSPFVIDSLGGFNDNQSSNPRKVKQKYLSAIKYINMTLMTEVENILNKKGLKPIIIIQSDHGSHLINLKETTSIFSAIYFSNQNYSDLTNNYNSVNTFRYIFNKYFQQTFKYLPNRNIYVHYPN